MAIRSVHYSAADSGVDPIAFERIVTICDRMLSYGDQAVDDALFKRFRIHLRWRAMFSGDDITPVTPLVRIAQRHLADREGRLEEVVDSFRNAFHEHSHSLAVDAILGKYGHTIASWRRKGREEFGDAEFARINQIVEQVEIGVKFLVCGFSPDKQSHLFTVHHEWSRSNFHVTIDHHDSDGFSIIGSGATAALSSLLRTALPITDLPWLIYRAREAKLLAERAPGVGKGTVLSVLECDPSDGFVGERFPHVDWDAFRTMWQNEGQPPIPKDAPGILMKALHDAPDWERLRSEHK
jgi:hypothetical protein